ncbi:TIGR03620 family F420-dependent LLM class oxidoreductase [Nocardia cyriacigeorgica]|uniref:TIGR03620 family F420-dependent LLM class oxidoreductase n=1 Tax=Nocardia cyriacigeorgica TaxID=135487 RepID=UPI001895F864|nr:TIGR03620 family F420-dependent LLM class oxidoreductase [Nocardia cyriacigeorgica]MBF6346492.1 TIGR03620 family F420-dependent LLM class oxidoreductase [Nocardia cyriacigeorgica]
MTLPPNLPHTGIWVNGLDLQPPPVAKGLAAELEDLGLGAIWLSEGLAHDPFVTAAGLLAATRGLVVGTGIAVTYGRHPHWMRASARAVLDAYPDRFVFGAGTSNPRVVEGVLGLEYRTPLAALRSYLDDLDAPDTLRAQLGLPDSGRLPRILAALGPRALELARDRADGAITYLTTPEHTAQARAVLGPDRTLVVEQAVVVGADDADARTRARAHVGAYLSNPGYRASWQRLGFTDADLAAPGSDRLVDALVAIGEDGVGRRIAAHLSAGADHVCLQALPAEPFTIPVQQWKLLAAIDDSSW